MPLTPSQICRCLAFYLVVITAASSLASMPDWARQASQQPLAVTDPEINAVVLLDETAYTIPGGDNLIERRRRVVKILRKEGRQEGELVAWLGHEGKLLSIHAWTIDKSGREYELKDKDFAERSPYSYVLYEDIRLRAAQAPAAEPGSVIAFEYEIRHKPWLRQLDWFFQENIPVHESRFVLHMPPGWEYKDFWTSSSAVRPTPLADGGWQWTVRDLGPIKEEPRMPAFLSLAGRMQLSYFAPSEGSASWGSWPALGKWYTQLTAGRRTPSPEIATKAKELTAGKLNFDGKVRTLATFLQSDVRYVAIEVGIGGYQPHAASDIFRARYGDCKDKATLLSSLLQAEGIPSEYVLIHTHRGVVNPEAPSSLFNHVILAIQLPAKLDASSYHSVISTKSGQRYLIFDPTDEYTPLGDLRSDLQDTHALLVTDSGGELIHTPLQAPDNNFLVREGRFTLNPDGSLTGEVVEKRRGDHAQLERYAFKEANQQQRLQRVERTLNRSLQAFTLQNSEIRQLDDRDRDLVLAYTFTVSNYAKTSGSLILVRPRVLGEKSFFIDTKKRQYPFELHGTSRETDTFEITLPQDFKADDVPDPVKVDMGFASYQSKTEITGSKLKYTREYVVRELRVNPERLPDLRKLENAIGADENSTAVLVHPQKSLVSSGR